MFHLSTDAAVVSLKSKPYFPYYNHLPLALAITAKQKAKKTKNSNFTMTSPSFFTVFPRLFGQWQWHENDTKVTCASRPSGANGEFKIYDATVAKTSLKIASSSLSIFLVLMSICLLANDVSTTCAEATWLWRWLPHRLSKRQSLTIVLLRTPINHMIFFNQGIISNVCQHLTKCPGDL